MKLLKRESMRSSILLKIKEKFFRNLLERTSIEFSLLFVHIFTKPNQIKNVLRRIIKILIIELYFLYQSNKLLNTQSK